MPTLTHDHDLGRRLVPRLSVAWIWVSIASVLAALFGTVAADCRWLAALGDTILDHGRIPRGVPFASAPSADWVNVPVLGEIVFSSAHDIAGNRGFLLLHVGAVAVAFSVVAVDLRRSRASNVAAATVLVLLTIGLSILVFVPIRAQLFSVALFPVLVLLLHAESRAPSRRIWLLVPLVALWTNLHGAVLVGVAVSAVYLLLQRARTEPFTALGVLAAELLAVCLTPALWKTPVYYVHVLENEAAKRGVGQWAPFSFHSVPDVVLAAGTLPLLVLAVRSRPRAWELVALAALLALTIHAARGGIWLALLAAVTSGRGLRGSDESRTSALAAPVVVALTAVGVFGLARGPMPSGASPPLLDRALKDAHGTAILAADQLAEQVALEGGRIWLGNPFDAFSRKDQRLYLDWLDGKPAGDGALANARVVLVRRGSAPDRRVARLKGFRLLARDARASLYVRSSPAT